MKTNRKIPVFMLSIAFCFIINVGSIQSELAKSFLEKSDLQLYKGNSRFTQEKTKYQYVGVEKCASICHNNLEMGFQYDTWKKSPHSKAFKSLASKKAAHYAKKANVKENPQESSVCLKCHVTGEGLDSSSLTVTYTKTDGVTCEACHKAEFIPNTFLPKEPDCLKCHNDSIHKMHRFNFKDKCEEIAHPRSNAKP